MAAAPVTPATQTAKSARPAQSLSLEGPKNAAPAAKKPAATPAIPAARKTAVKTASNMHPSMHPEPEMMYHPGHVPGHAYDYDPGCVDGYCEDGGFCDWTCGPRLKHWGSVEYLLWWRKGMHLPALVSTDPVPPGNILFGDAFYDVGPQSGGRATFGLWLDDYECIGVGGRFFALADGRIDFQQTAAGGGALSRPFIDADTGLPNAIDVAGPLGGGVDIQIESVVFGAEALMRRRVECGFNGRLDLLAGYSYYQINEEVNIRTSTTLPPGPPAALNVFDFFDTDNEFHGGTFGVQAEFDRGPFTVGLLTKASLGNMRETVTITGGNSNPNAAPGLLGLLVQNTNAGVFRQDTFAVVPEVNFNLGYRATEHLELSMGYSMIYWSHAVQPGDQIDYVVDVTPGAGTTRPEFTLNTTDYWVMGMNFGLQWSY